MKVSFMKIPRHRVFKHEPVYYDEAKERQESREIRARDELGLLSDEEVKMGYAARIKGGFRGTKIKPHYEVTRSAKRKSNIRLIIILVILVLLVQYFYTSGMEWLNHFIGN
jgi:hypothetical protein